MMLDNESLRFFFKFICERKNEDVSTNKYTDVDVAAESRALYRKGNVHLASVLACRNSF